MTPRASAPRSLATMMKPRILITVLASLVHAAAYTGAAAQDRERCTFPNTPQSRFESIRTSTGNYNTFVGGGVRGSCPSKEITLRADSMESYGDEGRIYLIGNVHYDEPRLSLTSNFLTYFQRDERFLAVGNVRATLPNGSTLEGPEAEYHRVIPGVRPVPRLHATRRPTITLVQQDTLGQPAPPTKVIANTVTMVGDSLVYAGGRVEVTREEVVARGDSMHLDTQREITVMLRSPDIEGKRERPFLLAGNRIELYGRNRKLDRVQAQGNARAVSEDMTLVSDTIELRVADDLLQRSIAWGPSRATASSRTQRIVSDSIDVVLPGQRLREMRAVRGALAQGRPDTLRFKADTTDWMRGDTIVALFDTTSTQGRSAQLQRLIAIGNARSYYHMAPADTSLRLPAINYVIGREIIVSFEQQRVQKVTVLQRAGGVYLEPQPLASGDAPVSARPTRPARPPQ